MYQETALFLRYVLENGKVDDLLTSRTSFVNAGLAALYGLPPTEGVTEDVFTEVMLPSERAGLLTQGSTLAMRARTNDTSVVSRGLYINSNVLCIQRPPAPTGELLEQAEVQLSNTSLTERARSDERAAIGTCGGCHAVFDTYGIVLEPFDSIGRFRTNYPNGEVINSTGKLPAALGTADISQPAELARHEPAEADEQQARLKGTLRVEIANGRLASGIQQVAHEQPAAEPVAVPPARGPSCCRGACTWRARPDRPAFSLILPHLQKNRFSAAVGSIHFCVHR
mgnify:CR=1 FL=1